MNTIFKKYGWTLDEWIFENQDFYEGPGVNNKLVCEQEFYQYFLEQTDYVCIKIVEAQILNVDCNDYIEVLKARDFARKRINDIKEECKINSQNLRSVE